VIEQAIDGGGAPGPVPPALQRARWDAVVHAGTTTLADGAMGTMLFASGLQFGDPPEIWNLTQPEVIRRIHRGYLDAGSRIILTNTFGGNRLRLSLHGNDRRGELNQMAALLLRAEVDATGQRGARRRRYRSSGLDHDAARTPISTRRSTSSRSRLRPWWPVVST
jgi:hypothetical protein